MIRLQKDRLGILRKYLLDCKLSPELHEEILDHLACEAEEKMWDGDSFDHIIGYINEVAGRSVLKELNADLKQYLEMDHSLTDMVFEGRNKQYGAYELRKGYDKTIQRSLIIGVTIFLFMIFLPDLYARLVPETEESDISFELDLHNVNIRPISELTKINNASASTHEVYDKIEVIPSTENLSNELSKYGLSNHANLASDYNLPSDLHFNEQLLELADGKGIFDLVDQKPEFVGGMSDLMNYIGYQINYPEAAVKKSIQGRVMIGFTVSTLGEVQNVEVIKGIGYGCDEEAKRVISSMPKWKPGRQGGELISTRFLIPVVFEIKKL